MPDAGILPETPTNDKQTKEGESKGLERKGILQVLFGDEEQGYNYKALCLPHMPCLKGERPPVRLFPVDEPLPLTFSLVMGLQHAFAMVGGLVTPTYILFRYSIDFGNTALQQYAIVAALITNGICTIVNVAKLPVPLTKKIFGRQLYIGSGLLSVVGTNFTFLPIYESCIEHMKEEGIDGTAAFGKLLGTSMACATIQLIFSLLPHRIIGKVFPPIVCAVAVTLIGVGLTGMGMKFWGGGVVCADSVWKLHEQAVDYVGPQPEFPIPENPSAYCENGDVILPFGSPEYIGLGFSVLVFLVAIEIFGSTFMKNCNMILALLLGFMVAGLSDHEGNSYVDSSKITDAPAVDFLWTEWFGIGFYRPAVIPMLIAYIISTIETIGDITATHEVSAMEIDNVEYQERIQGGLMSDAICS
ncbi:hypothetical protein ACHAWF_016716, partial [Thalassiosira exigua]